MIDYFTTLFYFVNEVTHNLKMQGLGGVKNSFLRKTVGLLVISYVVFNTARSVQLFHQNHPKKLVRQRNFSK